MPPPTASRSPSSRSTTPRSTTSAVTESGRTALAAVLIAELAAAAFLLVGFATPATTPGDTVLADGRTVRLVGDGGPGTGTLLDRVRAQLGPAVAAVVGFWGPDWDREILVAAAGTDREFLERSTLDPGRSWADIAAVSVADSVDPGRREASGQRIVFAPGAAAMSDPALRIVLTHELFHLAARADTALDAPRWLTEGVADFVARAPGPLPAGAAADAALPTDAELDAPGPGRSAGYDRAWWFARFVASEYGTDGLRRLYARACGPGHADLATAVRDALGSELAVVQDRWARWLSAAQGAG